MRPRQVANALWTVEFSSNTGSIGGGVIVLEMDRAHGGDGVYYYLGKYAVKSGIFECYVTVTYSNPAQKKYSIFGERDKFRVKLRGEVNDQEMQLEGHIEGEPDPTIQVRCIKRESLP
jgi:hypothetical protein